MSIKISLLHASYKSKSQGRLVRDEWLKLAAQPNLIEHCLGFENDDLEVRKEFGLPNLERGFSNDGLTKFATTVRENTPSAVRNWNVAANISSGQLLLGIADDLVPEKEWDLKIRELVGKEFIFDRIWKLKDSRCESLIDKNLDDSCPRHPLITRKLYEKKGFYFDPRYFSVGPDNEWLLASLNSGILRDGRTIKLHHTIGDIIDKNGLVACFCFRTLDYNPSPRMSQVRMHSEESVSAAQSIYLQWNLLWLLIGWIGVQKIYGKNLIEISQHKLGQNPLFILVKILFQKDLSALNRIKLTFGLGYELKAILISRRKSNLRKQIILCKE